MEVKIEYAKSPVLRKGIELEIIEEIGTLRERGTWTKTWQT